MGAKIACTFCGFMLRSLPSKHAAAVAAVVAAPPACKLSCATVRPGPALFPSPALGSEPDPVSGFGLRGPFFTPGGSENSVTAASPRRALQTPRGHTAAVRRARRLMPRPPGVVHGPRDAERQRGYRLTTGQVVHLLQHLNAVADGAQWYQVPLGELAAILAAAYQRKSHAALDGCGDGIWPLSVALRWRAGLLLQLPGAPRLQLWTHSAVAEWNPAFKAGVRRVWKQLARMRNGSRRPAGGGAPATTQRRSGPRAHPRANGIGMLQNEFPDTAIKSLVRGARRRIPSWHPPRVELPSDALSALLDDPDLPDDELFRLLPAPDFPTGGEILGLKPEPQP